MLDFGATVGSYLGSDYNQTRLKMDIYKAGREPMPY
jgi:hypothetical protein